LPLKALKNKTYEIGFSEIEVEKKQHQMPEMTFPITKRIKAALYM